MLASCFTLTDMPVVANPCSRENGLEIAEMAAIVWGGEAAIKKAPVTIVSVNPLSPLSYTQEAAGGKNVTCEFDDGLHDISLQGPKALELLFAHTPINPSTLKYFHHH
jgi:trimethylamine:corrinoid methyltransferase-like protein